VIAMSSVEQPHGVRAMVERLLGLQLEAEANTEEEAYAEVMTTTNDRYKLSRT
jgi:hypothetical protein